MFASFNARALGLTPDAATTLDLAASSGFAGVDLLVRDLFEAGIDPREIRARMDDLGLRGGAWPLPVDWRGEEGRFRDDLRRLPALARLAETLGLSATGTWVMPETPDCPSTEEGRRAHREEVRELHARRLGEVARILADHGTRLGLEVIGVESSRTGAGLPLFTRMGDPALVALLEILRADTPGVGLLVDAFHLYAAGEAMEVGWALGVESVVWVHVADLPASAQADRQLIRDANRGLPGENGAIDVRGLLRGLAGRGYEGPVTVEPLGGCRSLVGLDAREISTHASRALRRAWPTGTAGIRPTA